MWNVYRSTRKDEDYANYKEPLNAATTKIRKSNRSYEENLACNIKHDNKSFYAYVRSKQNVQDKVRPLGQLIVTPEMVAKKIKAMKYNKSRGVDGIPPKLLMETVEQISIPLARVFNLLLKEGVVPFEWKEANIIPLLKKGSRNKSENYRSVNLTSVICKLLERLIKDHMVDFLVRHNLLNPSQHGFLKARSCLTNMLCFLEEIT